jgi:hypothetical protein
MTEQSDREQKAEWIESAFGVEFKLRVDAQMLAARPMPESTLSEAEVFRIVDALTTRLTQAMRLLGKIGDERGRAMIQQTIPLIPTPLLKLAEDEERERPPIGQMSEAGKLLYAEYQALRRPGETVLDVERRLRKEQLAQLDKIFDYTKPKDESPVNPSHE